MNQGLAESCARARRRLMWALRARCRQLGYALAEHGSMRRDIDLVAIPWTHDAVPALVLVRELQATVRLWNGGIAVIVNDIAAAPTDFTRRSPQPKPHGRLAWSIHLGGGPYLDLSVMPRRRRPRHPRW